MNKTTYTSLLALPVAALLLAGCNSSDDGSGLYGQDDTLAEEKDRVAELEDRQRGAADAASDLRGQNRNGTARTTPATRPAGTGSLTITEEPVTPAGDVRQAAGTPDAGASVVREPVTPQTPAAPTVNKDGVDAEVGLERPTPETPAMNKDGVDVEADAVMTEAGEAADDAADEVDAAVGTANKDAVEAPSTRPAAQPATRPAYDFNK